MTFAPYKDWQMAAGSFASGVNTAMTLLHDIDFIYNTMLISYFSIVW
ncbi:hypothetical protein [Phyllobacterium sp. DC4000-4]